MRYSLAARRAAPVASRAMAVGVALRASNVAAAGRSQGFARWRCFSAAKMRRRSWPGKEIATSEGI